MSDKNTEYGLPEADQLVQCPSCKQHVTAPEAVRFEGYDLCDGCAENASIERMSSDLFLEEEIRDSQKEAAYIRKNFEGEFEDDFSREYMDA